MSENPSDSSLFRPLPRMQQLRTPKPTPTQLRPIDGVWIGLVTLLSFVHYALGNGIAALLNLRTVSAALCAAVLYLLGWRVRDRMTGLIAGLLLATDLPFPIMAHGDTASAALTVITTGALFAASARSWPIALSMAAIASLIRPDGVVLGGLLLALYLAEPHSKKPVLGVLLFLTITAVGWIILNATGHYHTGVPGIGGHPSLFTWAIAPATLFLAWFLLPYCAELADAPRRSRWLPCVLWVILFCACESLVHFGNSSNTWLPAIPIFFLLVAGGLARLLPLLAGEMQKPSVRYVIATVAVLFCIGIRTRLDWHLYRSAWVNMATKSNPAPITDQTLFTEPLQLQSPASPPFSSPPLPRMAAPSPAPKALVTPAPPITKPSVAAPITKPTSGVAHGSPALAKPAKSSAKPAQAAKPHATIVAPAKPAKTPVVFRTTSPVKAIPSKPTAPMKPIVKAAAKPMPKNVGKPVAKITTKPQVIVSAPSKPSLAARPAIKAAAKPNASIKLPAKNSNFIVRNGRVVRRSKWAILWEQKHPKGH